MIPRNQQDLSNIMAAAELLRSLQLPAKTTTMECCDCIDKLFQKLTGSALQVHLIRSRFPVAMTLSRTTAQVVTADDVIPLLAGVMKSSATFGIKWHSTVAFCRDFCLSGMQVFFIPIQVV